jgi:hypothetical protein
MKRMKRSIKRSKYQILFGQLRREGLSMRQAHIKARKILGMPKGKSHV